ncbi:MAG: hypothetical protein ACRDLB_08545 [Actinomycetota bacterium]
MFENKELSRDLEVSVQEELSKGRAADDETRLAVLEELYRSLELQLEGDLHQEGSARL